VNKDDKELFTKTNKKSVINLPYNFYYSGWKCTLSTVIKSEEFFVPFDLSPYEYVIDAGIIVQLVNTTCGIRQFYKKGTTVQNCIKHFKGLLLKTNKENLKTKVAEK
jgi:hypothetical protein